jgi:7-cyano-7-deazaguanine synthase
MKQTVLLFSGGMDSVCAWHLCGYPRRVYVKLGSAYEERELEHILGSASGYAPLTVLDAGKWLGARTDDATARVPMRNLFLAVAAAAATGADRVMLAATAGETATDKSRAFARAASRAMSQAEGRPVRLVLPVKHLTKRQLAARLLAALGRTRGEKVLRACPTCYVARTAQGTVGCGRCMSCVRRWQAMSLNGISERYEQLPWTWEHLRATPSAWWPFLRTMPLAEFPAVLRMNVELGLAVKRARQAML